MVWFTHDCPHINCKAKNSAFETMFHYKSPNGGPFIYAFSRCATCNDPVIAVFDHHQVGVLGADEFATRFESIRDRLFLITVFPRPTESDYPEHLPDNILAFFKEGAGSLPAHPNAAGTMFRKTVDVTLKILLPGEKGTFHVRINKAAKEGKLTADLAEWAHHVRLEGNDASHDEDPFTVEEAQSLEHFTRLFLMYVFTLPGMLQDWRARAES